jgi:predicted dehydrogenase
VVDAMYQGTYRAALIGHTGRGDFGHGMDMAFCGLPRVEIVACADPDERGRAAAARRSGAKRTYADYRTMLGEERPDLVAVCTRWPDQHEAMITAAAQAGVRAVLVEKPLAPSLEVADRIVTVCAAHDTRLTVAHYNRTRFAPREVQRLVAEGKIGRLRVIRAVGKCDDRSGGEDLLVLGTHLMDLMRFYAGEPRWCNARVTVDGRDATPADVTYAEREPLGPLLGDDVVATFGFDHGVTAIFESAPAADGGLRDYYHIELCGTAGIVSIRGTPGSPVWTLGRAFNVPDSEWRRAESPPAACTVPGAAPAPPEANEFFESNRTFVADLLSAVEEDRRTMSDGREATAALEMIVAVYASHLAGARLALPLADRAHPLAGAPPAPNGPARAAAGVAGVAGGAGRA